MELKPVWYSMERVGWNLYLLQCEKLGEKLLDKTAYNSIFLFAH